MNELAFVQLDGLKCFEHCRIGLSPITVLTGVNSGGKTTILQSLLLVRDQCVVKERSNPFAWPENIGGIPLGPRESFLRYGGPGAASVLFGASDQVYAFQLVRGGGFVAMGPVHELLQSKWRVVSTISLPLNPEQVVEDRDFEADWILDSRHALQELLRFDVRRKAGSLDERIPLRSTVERVLSHLTTDVRIDLRETDFSGKLRLMYKSSSIEGEDTLPEQTGAGVTAALPLVIHLCAAVAGEVLIAQDPEKHLHPRGQSLMGRELARCAVRGVRVIVETHSEHLLNGIKLGLLELGKSPAEDLACYYLDEVEGRTDVLQVAIDSRGLTRKWPKGFFDQAERDIARIARGIRSGE